MCEGVRRNKQWDAHSNCNAAILDGKPVTMQIISHGRSFLRLVLQAPPFTSPLCWPSRRRGSGVEPMYKLVGRTVDLSRYLTFKPSTEILSSCVLLDGAADAAQLDSRAVKCWDWSLVHDRYPRARNSQTAASAFSLCLSLSLLTFFSIR